MACKFSCPFSSGLDRQALAGAALQARQQAAEFGAQAAERIVPVVVTAAEKITPVVNQAAERITPVVNQAAEKITPVVTQAAERLAPYADQAVDRAKQAGAKAAGWAAERLEDLQPAIYSALDKVPPAVDRAHLALEAEVIPGVVAALHEAAGTAPAAALVVVKKTPLWRQVFKVAGLIAAVAAVAYAVKLWLDGSKAPAWSAHEPRQAYVYPDDASEASPEVKDYETDFYVGQNPPEGLDIKGNARSKKYHVPGSRNYDRTIAEVWFATEEAAQANGFTKAEG